MNGKPGYGVWIDRESGKVVREMDTVQCRHCQAHIFVKPGTVCQVYLLPDTRPGLVGAFVEEMGAWCTICNGPVCLPCHGRGECTPFMRSLERADTEVAQRDAKARLGWSGACNEGPMK